MLHKAGTFKLLVGYVSVLSPSPLHQDAVIMHQSAQLSDLFPSSLWCLRRRWEWGEPNQTRRYIFIQTDIHIPTYPAKKLPMWA